MINYESELCAPFPPKGFLYKWNRMNLTKYIIPKWVSFAGTYAIFSEGKCVYVGQSSNINVRLRKHLQMARYSCGWKSGWGYLSKISVAVKKEKREYERLMTEARFIAKLKPKFNKINGINFNKK